ncbi:oligopeptidase A [Candidatus Erwinia haradaeae]|uniref:oligopeptidase A n=1 Tax=Candidatus Erwinia haradaeae TaxID=1922217 RepID=A0A451DLS7_9GAMM|nr:oligopeptidase A [Candidatus Erwinia haradaeae]VFP87707.1 Oligopeptidase A [Candidatus Erwinia haradaeae]
MTNPLLDSFIFPPFCSIKAEHIIPAIKCALSQCREVAKKIIDQCGPYDWDNLVQPLMEADNYLSRVFSPISHLNLVKNDPELRLAYEQVLCMLSEYNSWVGQNEALYIAYCKLKGNAFIYQSLNIAQKKFIDNTLRDFQLSGIGLSKAQKSRYKEISTRLSVLSATYSNNVLDSTMGWEKVITDKNDLTGIPDSILATMKLKEKTINQNGWRLTLDVTSYIPVITYCDNRALREEIYYAYFTRASDQGPNAGKWDNASIMHETLTLRHELSKILGFSSYAEKSLVTKMAENSDQVILFLNDLAQRIHSKAEEELEQLRIFAKKEYNINDLQPWDIVFFSEKQKQSLYNISDEQLRPYFPENLVLKGLFKIVENVYGITTIERNDVEVYHEDVRFFELFDENQIMRGSFFLDLYVRDHKCSGAWMDDCVSRMRKSDGTLQKPIAYITCNFNRPYDGEVALFTHQEVITLFHEYGHGLHHMLTKIETRGVSGIHGVPWDAVEMPSQLMENWCWQPESLMLISGHYRTGKALPQIFLNKLLATKNYQIALFIQKQIVFSLFDFHLHLQCGQDKSVKIIELFRDIKYQISGVLEPKWSRFPNTFNHIFSGSYAAGYYSYLWANVLASDAWSRFETEGIFNRDTGQSLLDNVLTRGGSEHPMTLFYRFRGRQPTIDAMLKQYGITSTNRTI